MLIPFVVITRHGARTPFGDIPNYPVVWNCSLKELEVPSGSNTPTVSLQRVYRKNYLAAQEVLLGDCPQGQLTTNGFMNHYVLGQTLRSIYIDELEFLPTEFDPELIYIRSTGS